MNRFTGHERNDHIPISNPSDEGHNDQKKVNNSQTAIEFMTTKIDPTIVAPAKPVSSPRGPVRHPIRLNDTPSPKTPSTTKPWAPHTPPRPFVDTLIEMADQGEIVVPVVPLTRATR